VNAKGEVSGTTTTSGLSWKIPGRVGDSPIMGRIVCGWRCGRGRIYGKRRGEHQDFGGHTIVEMMRKGDEAGGMRVWRRWGRVGGGTTTGTRKNWRRFICIIYAVNKDGELGRRRFGRTGMSRGKWRRVCGVRMRREPVWRRVGVFDDGGGRSVERWTVGCETAGGFEESLGKGHSEQRRRGICRSSGA